MQTTIEENEIKRKKQYDKIDIFIEKLEQLQTKATIKNYDPKYIQIDERLCEYGCGLKYKVKYYYFDKWSWDSLYLHTITLHKQSPSKEFYEYVLKTN